MPRSRSSGALSIESNARNETFGLFFDSTFVIAAVNVVLPWSMCPIVPTFKCGLIRSNFSFAIAHHPLSKPCGACREFRALLPLLRFLILGRPNPSNGAGDGIRTRDHLLGRQRL